MPSIRTTLTRTIGDLRYFLQEGQVAFYLGAGVDILLASEARIRKSPDWRKMLLLLNFSTEDEDLREELYSPDTPSGKLWNDFVENWPAEIAALARWKSGDKEFSNRISELIEDPSFSPKIGGSTKALCELLSYSNVIFTTNYANYITKAMRAFNPSVEYVVLDREDLDGFVFPEPALKDQIKTCYLIHIHGRSSSKSFPILDAWGYNIAQSDDPSYLQLLETLFKNRHVITVGTSWSDVPLRNINGYLNRKYPYLGRSHLALIYEKNLPDAPELIEPHILWSNAMSAIYGVNFYFVDASTQTNALKSLVVPLRKPQKTASLKKIADFLDSTGDYESQLQHQWFAELGLQRDSKLSDQQATEVGVGSVVEKLLPFLESDKVADWITASRIERHLRHQIYLYSPANNATQLRLQIWNALFQKFKVNYANLKDLEEHLLFDFLTGVFEIANGSLTDLPELRDEVLRERLRIAQYIWKPIPVRDTLHELVDDLYKLENLAMQLLRCGWEAMSAKIITDKAFLIAKGLIKFESKLQEMDTPPFGYYDILSDSKRAEGIARVTGCFRRRTKVDVLDALWNKDPAKARNRLLSQLQSGTYGSSNMRIESKMKSAIGVGLVVNQFRFDESSFRKNRAYDVARNTLEEAAIKPEDALTKGNLNYWFGIVPSEMRLRYQILQKEVGGAT